MCLESWYYILWSHNSDTMLKVYINYINLNSVITVKCLYHHITFLLHDWSTWTILFLLYRGSFKRMIWHTDVWGCQVIVWALSCEVELHKEEDRIRVMSFMCFFMANAVNVTQKCPNLLCLASLYRCQWLEYYILSCLSLNLTVYKSLTHFQGENAD